MAINSFFDHQYPLLSRGADLSEPDSAIPTIVNYLGQTTNDNYTKHDGYDWGSLARANLGDSVLAAASGSATFINSCASCGNMIVIDHGNGYQTRYLHLLEDGLITNIPNQPIPARSRPGWIRCSSCGRKSTAEIPGNCWPRARASCCGASRSPASRCGATTSPGGRCSSAPSGSRSTAGSCWPWSSGPGSCGSGRWSSPA